MRNLTLEYGKGLTHLIEKLTAMRQECNVGHSALWSILTAFRGPDELGPDDGIKDHTTRQIRNWVITFDGEKSDAIRSQPRYNYGQIYDACGGHFTRHLRSAEKVIQKIDPTFKIFMEAPKE